MPKSAKEVVQEEEDEEKKAMEEKMKEEEELKKEKERQAFLDNIYVMVAMVIIVAGAVGIVFAKIHFFSEEIETGVQPIHQKVKKLFQEIHFWSVGFFPYLGCKPWSSLEGTSVHSCSSQVATVVLSCKSCIELC